MSMFLAFREHISTRNYIKTDEMHPKYSNGLITGPVKLGDHWTLPIANAGIGGLFFYIDILY